MLRHLIISLITASAITAAASDAKHYIHMENFISPPAGQATIGDGHGDIAVSASGDVYVCVQGGEHTGVQIFSNDGRYKGNLEGAASDYHGFRIHRDRDGVEYLYAAELKGQHLVKWSLDGKLVMNINVNKAIPSDLLHRTFLYKGVRLTGVAISSEDRIFVVDGYGTSRIHEFDQKGQYVQSLGGKDAPYNFNTAHKIAIDRRTEPERLLVTDRENNRLVWLDFDGNILATKNGLRRPSDVAISGKLLAVAELSGRVAVLDETAKLIAELGTNDNAKQISTPKVAPEDWRKNIVTSPHGVTFDRDENIIVTEWNEWGRVLKFVVSEQ